MVEFLILIASLLILIASMLLYRLASGESIFHLNMLNYSFYILFAMSFISTFLISTDLQFVRPLLDKWPFMRSAAFDLRISVWFMIMWMFIGLPLGAIFAKALFFKSGVANSLSWFDRNSPITIGCRFTEKSLFKLVFFTSLAFVIMFYLTMPEQVPLLNTLQGGSVAETQVIRQTFTLGFQNMLLRLLYNEGTFIFFSLISCIMSYQTGKKRWWSLFVFQGLTAIFLSVSKGTIGHVMIYFLGLAFCRAMLGKQFIKPREIVVVLFSLYMLFALFKGAQGSTLDILLVAFSRIAFAQMAGTYFSLEIFPDRHPFILFSSTSKALTEFLTGDHSESYGIVMMNFWDPVGVATGSAGHMSTVFMGEAWANFGLFGLILAPMWVGGVVQIVHRWFLNRPRSVILLAFYSYFSVFSFNYVSELIGFYYPANTAFFILGSVSIILAGRVLIDYQRRFFSRSVKKQMLGIITK